MRIQRENKIKKMGRGDGVNERLLENENNRLSDQLAGKISKLKQISIEMKVRQIKSEIFFSWVLP